jgi:hypothetical protein
MAKPILCLDFDGVIHSYTSGWKGADVIPDPPVPGAFQFIGAALQVFDVAVYSSRSGRPGGIEAMQDWMVRHAPASHAAVVRPGVLEWPAEKPAATVTIDDRALTFDGTWPPVASLLAFKPWNKRGKNGGKTDMKPAAAYAPAGMTVSTDGAAVHIGFDRPLVSMVLDKTSALALADYLRDHAESIG